MARRSLIGQSRDGRFLIEAASGKQSVPIVIGGKTDAVYRIFNSGTDRFKVSRQKTNGNVLGFVELDPRVSADVNASTSGNTEVKIVIETTAGKSAEGIYDLMGTDRNARSGRFKGNVSSSAAITMVLGGNENVYRIFNSGETAFTVSSGGLTAPIQLDKRMSVDVRTEDAIEITDGGANPIAVEGMYEILSDGEPNRTGRFKEDGADPPNPHTVAALKLKANDTQVFYRFFNTGKNDFNVNVNGNVIGDVRPDDSLDIAVGTTGKTRVVTVSATAKDEAIEGIYELIGLVDP